MPNTIQMHPLGRLGNQMFEYAFLKWYCEDNGYELQLPKCMLHELFDIPDVEPSTHMELVCEGQFEFGMKNIMVKDYCQKTRFVERLTRPFCRSIFKFKPSILSKPTGKFQLVGHLRARDFKRHKNIFTIVTWDSYKKAMLEYGYLPDTAFWVSDSGTSVIDDFMTLCRAEVLFRANSSFSLWSHILSSNDNQKCYSPILKDVGHQDCEFADNGAEPIIFGQNNMEFAR